MKPLLSRVIFHVDEMNHVKQITYEPAALNETHRRAARAASNLITRCNELLYSLALIGTHAPSATADPDDERFFAGYRQAIDEVQRLKEITRLRESITDARDPLHHSAQSALGGISIPRTAVVPAFVLDEVAERTKWRRT